MKKKIIVLAIATAVVIMAFILKSVLASSNSSKEDETDTSRIIIETITNNGETEVSQESATNTETITDSITQQSETTGIGIIVETLPPEETPSAAETTSTDSIVIEYSTIGDPETTKPKKPIKKKKKKKTKKETTKRIVKETTSYQRETQTHKQETTTKKPEVKKKLGSYYESNILSSSKISIIKNSVLSSVSGSSNSELTSLARYMSAHKLSNASSTYKSLTENSINVSAKTCSVNIESDTNDNIVTAAQKAASKIGKVSGTYGIGVSSFKAKSGYTIYVTVVYK